ncbi:hypothetical protein CHS0354_006917 [Potamilus streckersoni]|uniref:Uncharacterized protein n=1 Tax=Potamilus streckersoni TaxID=2493646 RepID=A0AAE0TEP7_9BIVA|nr:hypothetical protein CHS0354_006917 [Potamilus streckersoni]
MSQRLYNICVLKAKIIEENITDPAHPAVRAVKVNISWVELRLVFRRYDRFTAQLTQSTQIFRNGWTYFISAMLIYIYYERFMPEKHTAAKQKEQFLNIIQAHIRQNEREIPYFRAANFFMQLFTRQSLNLPAVIKTLLYKCPAVTSAIRDGLFVRRLPTQEQLDKIIRSACGWLELLEENERIIRRPDAPVPSGETK